MRYPLITVAVILIMCRPLSAQVADSAKFQLTEPYYFHLGYLKTDTAMLIDVREFFEYKRSRIKDAVNIPASSSLKKATDTIAHNCALFLYCTTDSRSNWVAKRLYDLGFRKLYSLKGGIVAWKKDGFPMEKKRIRRMKKEGLRDHTN
ncbi:MAG TPA: rhodanese-like domain-containing protein [Bacteroidales bacterium]|nr:rhodanese-like domain-containing protein [Bacteroidales bacterium]